MSSLFEQDINEEAFYRHNSGELEPIFILNYDCKGSAWVRWKKDDFINMISVDRIVKINYD